MSYVDPILLTGDQIAAFLNQPTNPQDPVINQGEEGFGMVITDAAALGGSDAVYRLVATQINSSDTFFSNGQFWKLEDFAGTGDPTEVNNPNDTTNWAQVPGYEQLSPRGDFVSQLGDGDDYIVFANNNGPGYLIYDLNGGFSTTPTNLFYAAEDELNQESTVVDGRLQFVDAYNAFVPICFCAGTLIATPNGLTPIEDLSIGDMILTLDHGPQPIRWIGRSDVSVAQTVINPSILPVQVAAGAMGNGLPRRDLWLSPQHRVMVWSKIAARITGVPESLVCRRRIYAT